MSTTKSRKVAVVTGANKGIGFALVKLLCQKYDGDVILCSRDEGRGKRAIEKLQEEGYQAILQIVSVEVPSTIESLKDFLLQTYDGLDLLVNNAALVVPGPDAHTPESLKYTMDVNYFGVTSVCDILFPLLRPGARVVHVSSNFGCLNWIRRADVTQKLLSPELTREDIDKVANDWIQDAGQPGWETKGWPTMFPSYQVSKILLVALTRVQQRTFDSEFPEKDIVVNAVHPGYIKTSMTMFKGLATTEEAMKPLSVVCFIPRNGTPRGEFIWEDGSLYDWNTSFEKITEFCEKYHAVGLPKTALNLPPRGQKRSP